MNSNEYANNKKSGHGHFFYFMTTHLSFAVLKFFARKNQYDVTIGVFNFFIAGDNLNFSI